MKGGIQKSYFVSKGEFCRFRAPAILSHDVKICIKLKVLKIRKSLILLVLLWNPDQILHLE